MNTIEIIYQDKKFFRLKESAKASLRDTCTELDIINNYDKLYTILTQQMQEAWRIK